MRPNVTPQHARPNARMNVQEEDDDIDVLWSHAHLTPLFGGSGTLRKVGLVCAVGACEAGVGRGQKVSPEVFVGEQHDELMHDIANLGPRDGQQPRAGGLVQQGGSAHAALVACMCQNKTVVRTNHKPFAPGRQNSPQRAQVLSRSSCTRSGGRSARRPFLIVVGRSHDKCPQVLQITHPRMRSYFSTRPSIMAAAAWALGISTLTWYSAARPCAYCRPALSAPEERVHPVQSVVSGAWFKQRILGCAQAYLGT